ncbi:2OG-Fe(II) oxygenase [Halotalea alkalilenta]|uniref:2OG-Fe(II) oxygenase n=1 Tax=Halotalea alkalilenta TaxID=376489 RepID=UPI000485E5CD|nr:2OG-Fe(II) oxygenase [Halotalea alkalilenta]
MSESPSPMAPSWLDDAGLDALIDQLASQGYALLEHQVPASLCLALAEELATLRRQQALHAAGIGRGSEHVLRRDIRSDSIHWLDRSTQAQREYFELMEHLRGAINRALFLGLFELEAHFAHYPPGSFYKPHLDSFRGRSNRVISSVLYLNPEWPQDGGGEMVIYPSQPEFTDAPGEPLVLVRPMLGTLVCFLSETMPHEVLPTRLPRASIAGWFRRNASLGGTIDPAL